ncbi:hypothetical protein pdam_00009717 [Pocillopora damicornis]|uniref:Uncharacterized protein n=1 Tax=Pocillopora damicornis TaxID=46731 RepID=A0A3M6TP66_POCDA|nr:hypothetical protein pdam_00009717 [Pocillopora damicornis]
MATHTREIAIVTLSPCALSEKPIKTVRGQNALKSVAHCYLTTATCVSVVAVTPAPRGYMSRMTVDKSEDMIFYNCDFTKQYHNAPNNKKNTVPGHGYFAKLASFEEEHCEKGD